jgi:hypothetical protein
MLAAPPGLADAGWVVRSHHGKKGGGSRGFGRWRRQQGGQVVGCTGRQQLLVRQGLIQHWMQQMNPRVRMRLGHPKELSLHLLNRMLFHVGQNEEPFVGRRWERTNRVIILFTPVGIQADRTGSV